MFRWDIFHPTNRYPSLSDTAGKTAYLVAYVQQIEEGKLKVSQAAKDLGVAEQTIYNWVKELRTDPKAGLPGSGHQKPDVEYQKKLEKENSELRKEVEFLKKAAAYFAVDQKKNTRS